MSSSFLEIVELDTGEVVLRRADGEGAPLVRIEFSEESKVFLNHQMMEVGKAMMGAGLSVVGEMYDLYEMDESGMSKDAGDRLIH